MSASNHELAPLSQEQLDYVRTFGQCNYCLEDCPPDDLADIGFGLLCLTCLNDYLTLIEESFLNLENADS